MTKSLNDKLKKILKDKEDKNNKNEDKILELENNLFIMRQ